MRFVIVRSLHVGNRVRNVPKAVIGDVPDGVKAPVVMAQLESAGLAVPFSEEGIPWANHKVIGENSKAFPADIPDGVLVYSWEELAAAAKAERRVTLRVPVSVYEAVRAAAGSQGLQAWCVAALAERLARVQG